MAERVNSSSFLIVIRQFSRAFHSNKYNDREAACRMCQHPAGSFHVNRRGEQRLPWALVNIKSRYAPTNDQSIRLIDEFCGSRKRRWTMRHVAHIPVGSLNQEFLWDRDTHAILLFDRIPFLSLVETDFGWTIPTSKCSNSDETSTVVGIWRTWRYSNSSAGDLRVACRSLSTRRNPRRLPLLLFVETVPSRLLSSDRSISLLSDRSIHSCLRLHPARWLDVQYHWIQIRNSSPGTIGYDLYPWHWSDPSDRQRWVQLDVECVVRTSLCSVAWNAVSTGRAWLQWLACSSEQWTIPSIDRGRTRTHGSSARETSW